MPASSAVYIHVRYKVYVGATDPPTQGDTNVHVSNFEVCVYMLHVGATQCTSTGVCMYTFTVHSMSMLTHAKLSFSGLYTMVHVYTL